MLGHPGPRVGLQALKAEGDAGAVPVQVKDVDFYLVANLDHLSRIVNLSPGELRDVDEAIGPAKIDESAEVRDACDRAGDGLALGQFFHDALALDLLPGTTRLTLRQDQAAAMAIYLDDLEPYLISHHLGQALPALVSLEAAGHTDCVGRRDEATDSTEGDKETTAVEA